MPPSNSAELDDSKYGPTAAELKVGGEYAHIPRVIYLARSEELMVIGVVRAMKRYKLSHAAVRAAMEIARNTRPAGVINGLMRTRDHRSQALRILHAELRYPGLHRALQGGAVLAEVGARYHISRERARQLAKEFSKAAALHSDPAKLLRKVEEQAQQQKAAGIVPHVHPKPRVKRRPVVAASK